MSRCTPDSVRNLLNHVKADVVNFVHVRSLAVNMNFMVGSLNFNANGSVEFKSVAAIDSVSTFSSMLPSEMRSRVGDSTDRGRSIQGD